MAFQSYNFRLLFDILGWSLNKTSFLPVHEAVLDTLKKLPVGKTGALK
jgi:hypothetical protein